MKKHLVLTVLVAVGISHPLLSAQSNVEEKHASPDSYYYWDQSVWSEDIPAAEPKWAPTIRALIAVSNATYSRLATEMIEMLHQDLSSNQIRETVHIIRESKSCAEKMRPVPPVSAKDCQLFQFKYLMRGQLRGVKVELEAMGVGSFLRSSGRWIEAEVDSLVVSRTDLQNEKN